MEFVRIYRLQKVIRNLQRDGFFGIFKIRKSAGDHKFRKGKLIPDPGEQGDPVHDGHPDIRKYHIRARLFHQRESLCTCLGCADHLKIRICFFNLMYQIIQKKFFIFCHNNSIVHSIIPPHLSENTVQ